MVFIAVASLFYVFSFPHMPASSHEAWGQFGDYFGGVLNPLLSFVAYLGLLATIHLQRTESIKNDSRHELQLYDARVFQLITAIPSIVSSIEVQVDGQSYQGRKLTSNAWKSLSRSFYELDDRLVEIYVLDVAGRAWDDWKRTYWAELSSYFEYVIFIVRSVVSPEQKVDHKKYYLEFLRSQMTTEEKKILFFFILLELRFSTYKVLDDFNFFNEADYEALGDGAGQALLTFSERVDDPQYASGPLRDLGGLRTVRANK